MSRITRVACAASFLIFTGCVYYNTFFHARQYYDEAEKQRLKSNQEFVTGGAAQKYNDAIKKASKVLQNHPKSKYADDALLMIGKSFYYTADYARAKEKFVELEGVFRNSPLLPEARFYQGMCEYYLGETEKSRVMLQDIARSGKKREFRDRAQFMLARIPFEEERYEEALPELIAYRKSGPDAERRIRTDSMIAVCYWEVEKYDSARITFARLADGTPDPELQYEALYRRAEAAYEAGDFKTGIEEFQRLADNDKFYRHLGMLEYQIAVGMWATDSVEAALEIFRRLPDEHKSSEAAARSLFALGQIYQERGDSLAKAQDYFKAVAKTWTGDRDLTSASIQRSSEIGQLLALQGKLSGEDSSRYAESHFLLGELYLRQLALPDSAAEQFRLVADDFSESNYAPLAILNLAEIVTSEQADTALADRLWRLLVARYPGTEASIWVRRRLGMPPPDQVTGSDILLMYAAEQALFDQGNADSALKLLDILVERYPESPRIAKAHFARAWIMDQYFPRDDSTVYYAYQYVVQQYPGTPYAVSARAKLTPASRQVRNIAARSADSGSVDTLYTDTAAVKTTIQEMADTVRTAPPPIEEGAFDYPVVPGYTWPTAVTVVFLIRINDRGEVESDIEMVGGSGYREIDEKAREAMLRTRFDASKLDPFLTATRERYRYSMIIPPPGQSKDQYQTPTQDPYQSDFNTPPFDQ